MRYKEKKQCNYCHKEFDIIEDHTSGKVKYFGLCGRRWVGYRCPQCISAKGRKKRDENKKRYCKLVYNNCQNCDKLFFTKVKASKACSIKCRQQLLEKETGYYAKLRESKKKIYNLVCKFCSKDFTSNCKLHKYCTKSCAKKQLNVSRRSTFEEKSCLRCEKIYTPKNSQSKFCSKECRLWTPDVLCQVCGVKITRGKWCKEHKPKKKNAEPVEKQCVTCEKVYKTKRPNSKYCKPNCSPVKKAQNKARKRGIRQAKLKCEAWSKVHEFYSQKGDMEVDHIIPLNHSKVCGLHVTWNMQYLSKEDNNLKSNSMDGTYDNEGWKNKI